jgi:tRNA threonylcarbamoyladenosine biosynthesis protein TsaB
MIHLAIECSGLHGSVALCRESELIIQHRLPHTHSSVQVMASSIERVIREVGDKPQVLSITHGPGSFTGLRVGLATAKILGWAWNIPCVPVDTLEVIAGQMRDRVLGARPTIPGNLKEKAAVFVPAINAFRGQVFTAAWRLEAGESLIRLSDSQAIDASQWMSMPLGSQTLQAGSGIPDDLSDTVSDDLSGDLPEGCVAAEAERHACDHIFVGGPVVKMYPPSEATNGLSKVSLLEDIDPDAAALAVVGWSRYQAGCHCSAQSLAANYIRRSAAEEKLPKKGLANNSN